MLFSLAFLCGVFIMNDIYLYRAGMEFRGEIGDYFSAADVDVVITFNCCCFKFGYGHEWRSF